MSQESSRGAAVRLLMVGRPTLRWVGRWLAVFSLVALASGCSAQAPTEPTVDGATRDRARRAVSTHPLRAALARFAAPETRAAGVQAFGRWLRGGGELPARTCAAPLSLLKTTALAEAALADGASAGDVLRLAERLRTEAMTASEQALAYRLAALARDGGATVAERAVFRPQAADDVRLVEVEARCMVSSVKGPSFSGADRAAVGAFAAALVEGAKARAGRPEALAAFVDAAIAEAPAGAPAAVAPPPLGATLARHRRFRASWPGGGSP